MSAGIIDRPGKTAAAPGGSTLKTPGETKVASDRPKTTTGKPSRHVLRDREYAQQAGKAPQ
ncbi:MAG: hypothetical protein COC12_00290 [Rhodobacteraceae bacterium]|nr:MAG: hypothetical protein COC12_00290 [Paracoccaceae bacterium]